MINTKIFIINLEKDKERYINIINQIKKFKKYNYQRIDAVNGKILKKNYGNKISKSEIGCFLSHVKTLFQIIEQKLDYAIILEDDVIITNWFNKIEEIISKIYPNFDICWIGNSEGKWPRNACNIIPEYNYNKLNFTTNYLVKLDMEKKNNPVGTYGLIITQKGACKILTDLDLIKFLKFENTKNFEIQKPIDIYYLSKNLDRYMTIPSIIIHCYNFGSNISYQSKEDISSKINPFEDIWGLYKKEEIQCLEILQNLENLLTQNKINYSLINSALLGFMRTNKLLYYDDRIDIIINKNDLIKFEKIENEIGKFANILKLKKSEINNSLFYKIFCRNNSTWPFINVFIYEYLENSKLNILSNKIVVKNMSEKTKMVEINSNNNNLKYKTRIFEDSEKILNQMYPNWRKICSSPEFSNRRNMNNIITYSFNCENIIPEYKENLIENGNENGNENKKYTKFYKKTDKYFTRNLIINLIIIVLFLTICIFLIIKIVENKKNKK